jgi:hypothetical protein
MTGQRSVRSRVRLTGTADLGAPDPDETLDATDDLAVIAADATTPPGGGPRS